MNIYTFFKEYESAFKTIAWIASLLLLLTYWKDNVGLIVVCAFAAGVNFESFMAERREHDAKRHR